MLVTRGVQVAHRYTMHRLATEPRCAAGDPVFNGVGLAGSKGRANAFLLAYAANKNGLAGNLTFYYFYLSLLSVYRLVFWGCGLRANRAYITLS